MVTIGAKLASPLDVVGSLPLTSHAVLATPLGVVISVLSLSVALDSSAPVDEVIDVVESVFCVEVWPPKLKTKDSSDANVAVNTFGISVTFPLKMTESAFWVIFRQIDCSGHGGGASILKFVASSYSSSIANCSLTSWTKGYIFWNMRKTWLAQR